MHLSVIKLRKTHIESGDDSVATPLVSVASSLNSVAALLISVAMLLISVASPLNSMASLLDSVAMSSIQWPWAWIDAPSAN